MFDPITRRTVADEVREALYESIRNGDLPPGSQMPSERTLCEQFAVARTSVREAVQGLVLLGVITRRGNRSYVAEHLPGVSLDDSRKRSVTDIFEIRRVIEVPMAELAALRAGEVQRTEISTIAASFDVDMSLESFRAADRRFHEAVASACGNPAFAELHSKVLETLFRSTDFDSLLSASENQDVVRRVIRDATKAHREIASRIEAGDIDGVRKATEKHLTQVEALMVSQMT